MKEKTRAEHVKKNLTYYSVSQKRRKKEEVEKNGSLLFWGLLRGSPAACALSM